MVLLTDPRDLIERERNPEEYSLDWSELLRRAWEFIRGNKLATGMALLLLASLTGNLVLYLELDREQRNTQTAEQRAQVLENRLQRERGEIRDYFEQRVEVQTELIEQNPRDYEAYKQRGNMKLVLSGLGDGEDYSQESALEDYLKAVEINPDYAKAHANAAIILRRANQPERAEQHLRRAVELRPSMESAQLSLARVLFRKDRKQEAVAVLTKYLERNPDSLAALEERAHYYQEIGREEAARSDRGKIDELESGSDSGPAGDSGGEQD